MSAGLCLATVAWILIAVFTYAGILLSGEGEGVALAATAGVLIFGMGGFYLAVAAKTSETDASGWGNSEYFFFALSVAAVIFAGYYGCTGMRYVGELKNMSEGLQTDIDAGRRMINSFREQESTRLLQTETGLKTMVRARPVVVPHDLNMFLNDKLSASLSNLSEGKVQNFVEIQKSIIMQGSHTEALIDRYLARFDSLEQVVKAYEKPHQYKALGPRLHVTVDSLGIFLTSLSDKFDFPEITSDAGGYRLVRTSGNVYQYTPNHFMQAYNEVFANSWKSIVGFVVLALFALGDYFAEFRRSLPNKGVKLSDEDCIPL